MKYRFKLGQEVFKCSKLIYFESQAKYRQKEAMIIKGRHRLANGTEVYFTVNRDESQAGCYTGAGLTAVRERVIGHVMVLGEPNAEPVFSKEPFTEFPENAVFFRVLGVVE